MAIDAQVSNFAHVIISQTESINNNKDMYQSDKVRMKVFGYDIQKFTVSDQHDQICFNEH